ncbi:RodZ domain-containing protein [Pokkaliibacter sp. CJK22405]|uniref:RodZ domain-containing protein n=1 Tax=Pokkaliibacter sp. CJK22405 TaxID=3384615 RepID=UPI003984B2C2
MNETDDNRNGLSSDGRFPGDQLRQGRENLGLTLEDVAKQLHLTRFYVQALENGDFGRLPNPTFVRGYLKAYARIIGEPEEKWLGYYEKIVGQPKESKLAPLPTVGKAHSNVTGRWLMKLMTFAFVLTIVVITLLWFKEQRQFTNPSDVFHNLISKITVSTMEGDKQIVLTDPQTDGTTSLPLPTNTESSSAPDAMEHSSPAAAVEDDVPAASTDTSNQGTASADISGANDSASSEAPSAENVAGDEVAPAAEGEGVADVAPEAGNERAVIDNPIPTGPAGTEYLQVSFTADCWFQVQDGDGKKVVAGIKTAGDQVAMHVKPPVRVVMGYAPGVSSISLNNKAVDLSQYDGKEVVRLTLKAN